LPNVFDLFGTISLDTRDFDGSIKHVSTQLNTADAQLDKVISTSNKLGDTSATVGRRYEKFSESIEAQKQKLIANALAFEKGDISAKQFGNTIVSVDRQVAGLNSRLKDAAARATELGETGGTHFQNQIGGAIAKQHSLINLQAARPLQGLGPVLQGLGARQYGLDETLINILIVAARETGILKVAQEGVATATTIAAVEEAKLYKASELAAIYAKETAVGAEATAAATTEASTATTLLGSTLATVGGVLVLAVSSIAAAYKLTSDIRAEAEKRLQTELAIEGAINRQYEAYAKFKKELVDAADKRQSDSFLKNAGIGQLQFRLENEQNAYESEAKSMFAAIEAARQQNIALGLTGNVATSNVNSAVPAGYKDRQDARQSAIKDLQAQIAQLKASNTQSSSDFVKGVQGRQVELFKQGVKDQEKAAKDASEAQKKAAEAAKKLAEALERAGSEVVHVFSQTTDNPFSKILEQRAAAVLQLRDAFKDIGLPDIHRRLKGMINEQTERSTVGQRISTNLSILGLQEGYEQFSRGTTDSNAVSFYKQALANPNLRGDLRQQYTRDLGYVQSDEFHKKLKDQVAAVYEGGKGGPQDVIDKQLLGLAQNLKPEQLDRGEQKTFADAFLREIKHKAVEEKEAKERDKEMGEILKKLSAGSLNTVTFKDESNSVKSITSATPAATANRYH
jgi:hypothetical protein